MFFNVKRRCDRHPIRPSSLYPTEELPSDSYMPVADKKFSHVLKNPDDYRYADACPRIRQMSLISRTRSCPSCTEKAANETSNNKNRFFSGNNAAS
ncbi:unnamed protein product [Notodromas monacha]|uniref:Uncharacterized protein n=1 Tax=Notodromas monacha TaxID=399045 RepID=A0A7R9GH32_9CRUS|nr:unnamed protein product [Notodromas monacha]CAG0920879.1 unnamed protein product [Notodromas monacha]